MNILYIFSSFSPLPQVPPCFKTVICYNCYLSHFKAIYHFQLLDYFLYKFAIVSGQKIISKPLRARISASPK